MPDEILPVAFTPDNLRFLVRSNSGVQIFNLRTGEEEDYISATRGVLTAALSPDGQMLAWSLDDNTLQLLRLADHKLLATLEGHQDVVYDLRFSPLGDRLFSGSHDGTVRIWDDNGNQLSSILASGEVLGIGIAPDGKSLAIIAGWQQPMQLWDLRTNQVMAVFEGALGYDTSDAVFSPDGQYMAADLDNLLLWRVSDRKLLWEAISNSMAVIYSPDGRFLAYSDINDGNKIILASPDGARIIRVIAEMQAPVWEMFFSPDGSLIAATDGAEIRIWGVDDGKLRYVGKTTCT